MNDQSDFENKDQTQAGPDWKIGDICYVVMNKAKGYVYPFRIKSITDKGYYFVESETNRSRHNLSPQRMFRTKEDALNSLKTDRVIASNESANTEPAKTEISEKQEESDMNEWDRLHRQAEHYKAAYPPGTRIMLLHMGDDPRPIEDNMRGTVKAVDDLGTLHCSFDNGRSLGIVPGEDSFRKLTDEELAEEQIAEEQQQDGPVLGM